MVYKHELVICRLIFSADYPKNVDGAIKHDLDSHAINSNVGGQRQYSVPPSIGYHNVRTHGLARRVELVFLRVGEVSRCDRLYRVRRLSGLIQRYKTCGSSDHSEVPRIRWIAIAGRLGVRGSRSDDAPQRTQQISVETNLFQPWLKNGRVAHFKLELQSRMRVQRISLPGDEEVSVV